MTTHQVFRLDQQIRGTARRLRGAVLVTALATVLTIAGLPGPASAAVPRAAQKWSALMYHSLTPSPAYVRLRKTLAAQRATLAARGTRLTEGKAAHQAAQDRLTTAVTADAFARIRYAVAGVTLTSARNSLVVVSQRRPRNGTAVAQAKNTITSAAETMTAHRTRARQAAGVLRTARATARAATVTLDKATVAWQTASATVRTNQQKLVSLDRSTELAGEAARLSRAVVTEIRSGFTVADTTTVSGVTVHKSVAFTFRRMLADARADGIVLSGGGFRTRQRQIELRKINGCPDVWTAPASSCRVPTAIPGRSLHEIGLAVDLTSDGRSLTGNSAAFRWLDTHAARYGYVNLPSEAWHWSITGG